MSITGLDIQYTAVCVCPDVERYNSMLLEFQSNPKVISIVTDAPARKITLTWEDTDWRGWL